MGVYKANEDCLRVGGCVIIAVAKHTKESNHIRHEFAACKGLPRKSDLDNSVKLQEAVISELVYDPYR